MSDLIKLVNMVCGAAVLRCCGAAVLRCCGAAVPYLVVLLLANLGHVMSCHVLLCLNVYENNATYQ